MQIKRGDILIVDLKQKSGTSLQAGIRPAIVISNNKANTYSTVITVVPLTSKIYKKRYMPTHVFIKKQEMCGLERHALVLAEQITSIAVDSIIQRCGNISKKAMDRITKAVEIQMGIGKGEDDD
nr:type II toxin-antitoxin system PemK/MazF family toxin [uncultured Blautia sp.]